jgi:hypothetical protein
VKPLPDPPTPAEAGAMGGRGHKASSDRTSFSRGENAAYLAARLKRDHPEIARKINRDPTSSAAADPCHDRGHEHSTPTNLASP